MLTSTPRKLIAAALTAVTLSVGFAATAQAHPHHGHHGHWGHRGWGGGFFPIVIGVDNYPDCYYVRERFVGRDGRIHIRRVKVCN